MKKIKKIVNFGGYRATGGSVIRDIFLENKKYIHTFPCEFRLLNERYGLFDLQNTIFSNAGPENIDLAIRDFLWLTKNLARNNNKFAKQGLGYNGYTNEKFLKLTNNFINSITDYVYPMNWHFYNFKRNYLTSQFQRYASKFIDKNIFDKSAFMAYPEFNDYIKKSKLLIKNILLESYYKEKSEASIFALHNTFNPFNLESLKNTSLYFDNFSTIIVDRDPRDIFLDFPNQRYLPKGVSPLEKAKIFIKFFKDLRKERSIIISNKNVLFLQFEDLVLNTNDELKKINNFLGLNENCISSKEEYFIPSKSKKNIRKYEKVSKGFIKAIDLIEKDLEKFLYK